MRYQVTNLIRLKYNRYINLIHVDDIVERILFQLIVKFKLSAFIMKIWLSIYNFLTNYKNNEIKTELLNCKMHKRLS